MKQFIRKITPKFILQIYHLILAELAAFLYGYPSEKLIVIGVTGTKGKSTTANLIAQFLEADGFKVGLTSTATMKIAEREWLSDTGMTMPGRFRLQKLLRAMVRTGCQYAVIETSSEGIAQFRSRGIHYDVVVLTNLMPEHLEAHGSYENYRAAKGKLFWQLKKSKHKKINNQKITKTVVLNPDDKEYKYFSDIKSGEEWCFGLNGKQSSELLKALRGEVVSLNKDGATIVARGVKFESPLLFEFNVLNVLAAMTVCLAHGVVFEKLISTVPQLKQVPGRQEFINEGQDFLVMVDYTYEPSSMTALYKNLSVIPHKRVIHILGPAGGGRDKWRIPVMGNIAATNADIVIATTDDPYDDDPSLLADKLMVGARQVKDSGRNVQLLKIVDRRKAIAEAINRAEPDDLVLIAGRGAEQKMSVANGRHIPWDDRQVVRELLALKSPKL